jgi:SAM-dependent methyltransferase
VTQSQVKQEVRQFYDRVGWQVVSEGMYQNARYEDLRPVTHDYIHRCHLRVKRFLKPGGRFLLDAGSGPVQYPEYLTYSEGYAYRVCADISIVALKEARQRLGEKGLYVVADVANLPFKAGVFEGLVSLHTLHHLPAQDHDRAYSELYRALAPGCSAVVVNGWTESPLMRTASGLVTLLERLQTRRRQSRQKQAAASAGKDGQGGAEAPQKAAEPTGTFIQKFTPAWLHHHLDGKMDYTIGVWRSVNVRFLRAVIHPRLGGRFLLKVLFWLEERFPRFFGEKGQYPLIVIRKGPGKISE